MPVVVIVEVLADRHIIFTGKCSGLMTSRIGPCRVSPAGKAVGLFKTCPQRVAVVEPIVTAWVSKHFPAIRRQPTDISVIMSRPVSMLPVDTCGDRIEPRDIELIKIPIGGKDRRQHCCCTARHQR